MTTPPRLQAPSSSSAPSSAPRPTLRRVGRAGVLAVLTATVLLAAPAQAATPIDWPSPPEMSLLTALLLFGGIPLALIAVITLLVMAPSLVRGDRQQRGVASWTEPQWFGGPRESVPAGRHAVREVGPGGHGTEGDPGGPGRDRADEPGGASARW